MALITNKYDTFLALILIFHHNRHIISIQCVDYINIYYHHKPTFLHKKQIYNKSCENFLSNRSSLVKTHWPSEFLEKKSIYRYRQNLKQNAEWEISKEKGKRWSEVRNDRRNVRRNKTTCAYFLPQFSLSIRFLLKMLFALSRRRILYKHVLPSVWLY